ncbi:MAG: ASCH domain-containing protein [Chloroflexota bacterium]
MKAISLWQPWASAIALGSKRIETRGWATAYRGPLAIHAAKLCIKSELRAYSHNPIWKGALDLGSPLEPCQPLWESLPFGAIVAVVRLKQCYPTYAIAEHLLRERHKRPWDGDGLCGWTEYSMGDFGPGRFGWLLADVRALPKPIPFRGAQGFFEVPDSLL